MRRMAVFAAALLAAAAVVAMKYDDWFAEPKLIAAHRGYVVQQMRDPSSVQFRAERLTERGWLCGELNGKNWLGAYSGFTRFMARSNDDAWIEGSGYAGSPDARSTAQIVEDLGTQNSILSTYLDTVKARPSPQEIDAYLEKQMFQQRWQKHCT